MSQTLLFNQSSGVFFSEIKLRDAPYDTLKSLIYVVFLVPHLGNKAYAFLNLILKVYLELIGMEIIMDDLVAKHIL